MRIFSCPRLDWIARGNIVVGAVSLLRLMTEMQLFWTRQDWAELPACAVFDALVGSLWIAGGLLLKSRHSASLQVVALSAGAAAARTIISVMLFSPRLLWKLWKAQNDPEFLQVLGAVGSRFLHYGIEFVYWPIVLFAVLKASQARHPWQEHDPELSTGVAFAAAGSIGAVVEVMLIASLA